MFLITIERADHLASETLRGKKLEEIGEEIGDGSEFLPISNN
jgi:hypothetical protein